MPHLGPKGWREGLCARDFWQRNAAAPAGLLARDNENAATMVSGGYLRVPFHEAHLIGARPVAVKLSLRCRTEIARARRSPAIDARQIIDCMKLRPATSDDVSLIRAWDKQPHALESAGDFFEFDWEGEIPRTVDWREVLIAEIDGRPIGMMQIIDPEREETHYWGDVAPDLRAIDIWIGNADDLGRGYGTEMMRLAIERCFAPPEVTAILIDPLVSNTRAHRFYGRMGFCRMERRMFGDDYCYVYRLTRAQWQAHRSM
jgi:aminoglycoside 6'-N-acetyltransferase